MVEGGGDDERGRPYLHTHYTTSVAGRITFDYLDRLTLETTIVFRSHLAILRARIECMIV